MMIFKFIISMKMMITLSMIMIVTILRINNSYWMFNEYIRTSNSVIINDDFSAVRWTGN